MRNFVLCLIVLLLLGAESFAQMSKPASTMPSDVRVADQARLLRQQVKQLQTEIDRLSPPDEQADQPMQENAKSAGQDGKSLFRIMPKNLIEWAWFLTGMLGEFVFFLRFVVQWLASERAKKTVVPMMFWHLSLIGTAMVLAYALYKLDPVFILAYSLNILIYVRNLTIARRHHEREAVMEKTSE